MRKIGGQHLVRLIGSWATGTGPLYRQLGDALSGLIDRGEIGDGVLLPPERALARHLSVSRTTVVAAYDRAKDAGLVSSRQGRGTVVTAKGGRGFFTDFTGEIYSAVLEDVPDVIDLTSACQTAGSHLRTMIGESIDLGMAVGGHGYEPRGILPLRQAVAAYMSRRGVATEPDQIVITTGAQQAIALATSLEAPNSTVLTEQFTFPGALDLMRRQGLRPIGVPMDAAGIHPGELAEAVERHRPSLVFLSPSFNNPTGVELASGRRDAVLKLAAAAGIRIIEDNTLELLHHGPEALPPLAAASDSVVSIGSLSKSAWGGLRVGWLRADPSTAEALARAKTVLDIGSPILNQHIAVPVVTALPRLVAEIRSRIVLAHRAAAATMAESLPEWECPLGRGGLCSWVRAPGIDIDSLAQRAQRNGVVIAPGSIFSPSKAQVEYFRLPLIYPPATMVEAIRRLTAVVR